MILNATLLIDVRIILRYFAFIGCRDIGNCWVPFSCLSPSGSHCGAKLLLFAFCRVHFNNNNNNKIPLFI